jgi:hypothetical protein
MCKNIENNILDLIVIVDKANDFYEIDPDYPHAREAKEYLESRYGVTNSEYFGFKIALELILSRIENNSAIRESYHVGD